MDTLNLEMVVNDEEKLLHIGRAGLDTDVPCVITSCVRERLLEFYSVLNSLALEVIQAS